MTADDQAEIKSILRKNQFKRRYRSGRAGRLPKAYSAVPFVMPPLRFHIQKEVSTFSCRRSRDYAEKPCISFESKDLDESILRELFKVLKAPPIEILKSALEASRTKKQTRQDWIRSERERFAHEELVAQEHADACRGRFPQVYFRALEKLEKLFQERKEFEQQIALERPRSNDESEKELEELCRIASDVPSLWHHEAVTHKERKEILRCLVDYIVIAACKEKLDATIFWRSGAKTSITVGAHGVTTTLFVSPMPNS